MWFKGAASLLICYRLFQSCHARQFLYGRTGLRERDEWPLCWIRFIKSKSIRELKHCFSTYDVPVLGDKTCTKVLRSFLHDMVSGPFRGEAEDMVR
jgi:hypothetical protein